MRCALKPALLAVVVVLSQAVLQTQSQLQLEASFQSQLKELKERVTVGSDGHATWSRISHIQDLADRVFSDDDSTDLPALLELSSSSDLLSPYVVPQVPLEVLHSVNLYDSEAQQVSHSDTESSGDLLTFSGAVTLPVGIVLWCLIVACTLLFFVVCSLCCVHRIDRRPEPPNVTGTEDLAEVWVLQSRRELMS
mmetsp:Transcript_65085/g.172406  ORF Transcript_65085/g.172406 Transcript_65085/m.172406 type:complete len:194 (-) Transcript_65085:115-696(-)